MIQLGDFGFIWKNEPDKNEIYWMNWLSKKPWTTLVIPGNHENYFRLLNLPETIKFDNPVWVYESPGIEKDIFILQRGYVYNINGVKILAIGGAESIDKYHRVMNIDWWREETLSYEEETRTLQELDKHQWRVDFVLSHTCPLHIAEILCRENNFGCTSDTIKDPVSKFLYHISKQLTFKEWHFGHWHVDWQYKNYFCHFLNPPTLIKE